MGNNVLYYGDNLDILQRRQGIMYPPSPNVNLTFKKAPKATQKATGKTKRDTGERGAPGAKRGSGLDAAAQVLADAKEPLSTGEMVERMLKRGLWKTSGKTPAATIYSAIIREMAAKGKDARFKKVDKGKFAFAG